MRAAWLAAATGPPALVAAVLGAALALTTGLRWPVAAAHVAVGAAGGLACAALALAASLLPSRLAPARLRYAAAGFPFFLLLVFAGLGAWVARRSWGLDLSGSILAGFLPHAPELVSLLGWRVVALLAGWVALAAAPCALWVRALSREEGACTPAATRRASLVAAAACVALVSAAPRAVALAGAALPGDPLAGLFATGEQPALPPTAARFAAWADDEVQRRLLQPQAPSRRNIVLVLSDGIRPDHLSFHGYGRETTPFLASLAAQPGWREAPRAYSAATESLGGIGSIVSGRSTRTMGARSFGLVEFLARNGYRTHLLMNGAHGWYELRAMYGSKLTTFHDLRDATPGIPLHDDDQVAAWARELPPADGQPAFVMMFLMGTHQLSPLAAQDVHFSLEDGSPGPFWFPPSSPAQWKAAVDRYDDQLRATDRRLREIWGILEAKGYLDDALVVYSSDHGQMLGEHGAYGHGAHLWEETIRIPMALWTADAGLPPVNASRTAWTPDLAPTIAEAAGLQPLPTWEGLSLFSGTPRTALWVDSVQAATHVRAVLLEEGGQRWKLQQQVGPDGQPVAEHVFELSSDPAELRDRVADVPPAVLAELRRLAAEAT